MTDILSAYGVRPVSKRKKPANADTMTPEAEATLTQTLGRKALGTASALGNFLDVPRSMVTDVMTWAPGGIQAQNPLDQLLSPFTSQNRIEGRQLLRSAGLAGGKDNWKNFGAGFALETASDPLTYLTLGASALSKAGMAAKAAGAMDNATLALAKKTGRNLGQVGSREARVGTTLRETLAESAPDAAQKAAAWADKQGLDINDLLDKPLGGNIGIGLPFSNPIMTIGNNTKLAKLGDDVARTLRYAKIPGTDFAPIHNVMRAFDYKSADMTTPLGIQMGKRAFDYKTQNRVQADLETAQLANRLKDMGMTDMQASNHLRQMAEVQKYYQAGSDEAKQVIDQMVQRLQRMPADAKDWGIPLKNYIDDYDYFPRQLTFDIRSLPGSTQKAVNTRHGAQNRRKEFLFGMPEGTIPIIDMAKDADIEKLFQSGASVKQVATEMSNKYGGVIPATYDYTTKSGKVQKRDRFRALAKWMGSLNEETRKTGVFGNHMLLDYQARLVAAEDAMTGAKVMLETLIQPGVMKQYVDAAYTPNVRQLSSLLKEAGINMGNQSEGFGRKLLAAKGFDISTMPPDQAKALLTSLGKQGVDINIANDLVKQMKSFSEPESVGEILDFVDSASNFWKGSLTTPWPAFHVRNLLSGQWMNMAAGTWSRESLADARDLAQGRAVKGAKDIPEVQQIWAQRQALPTAAGMPQQLDDLQATRILGEMAAAYRVIGKYEGDIAHVAGRVGAAKTSSLDETITGIPGPGRQTFDPARVGRKFIGRDPGTSMKPWDVRGVGGRIVSGFGPMAAGEEVGHAVESMNRLAPWIKQLKEGVSARAAADKVGAVQVNYQDRYYSKLERQKLVRLFPWYKFTARTMPYIIRNLLEHPGGVHANTLRFMESAHQPDTFTPDYVTDTVSIPVRGTPLEYLMGTPPEGHDRYVAGLGLPIETLASMGPGPIGALQELGSQLNPIPKAAIELMTQQTLFQKGPQGGRPLRDLDPILGRLISNVTGADQPVKFPGSTQIDYLLGMSPLSRPLSTANMLTDTRRSGAEKALNTLTGVRTRDVSPAAKERLQRDMLREMMLDAGGREFVRTYMPNQLQAESEQAAQLQAMANILAARAKARNQLNQAKQ